MTEDTAEEMLILGPSDPKMYLERLAEMLRAAQQANAPQSLVDYIQVHIDYHEAHSKVIRAENEHASREVLIPLRRELRRCTKVMNEAKLKNAADYPADLHDVPVVRIEDCIAKSRTLNYVDAFDE